MSPFKLGYLYTPILGLGALDRSPATNTYIHWHIRFPRRSCSSYFHLMLIGSYLFDLLSLSFSGFPMATILKNGKTRPLNLTSGTVLVLKSTNFPFAMVPFTLTGRPSRKQIQLALYNNNGDTIFHMTFGMVGKRHELFCNDRVHKSFGDGWGKAQKADTSYVDFERWRQSGVRISVHHHSTDSEFGRYQILLGNDTVCNFDKRLPGPATRISYTGDITFGPESWTLSGHQVSDLHPREREILVQQM